MMKQDRKRRRRSRSSQSGHVKRLHSSPSTTSPHLQIPARRTFASYLDTPDISLKVKVLCEIVANTSSTIVEQVLDDAGIRVSQPDIEEVLKLSYGYPASAVKFFRWSGHQINDRHSPYAWNLVVDMLGKNCPFDAMWDAIKSMKREGLSLLATFASVFESYVLADRVSEVILTFEVMNEYGIARDVVALNSLFSAICRDGKTEKATEFLQIAKDKIRPDADTYAILLEGWENEGNMVLAKQTFNEMVVEIGWDTNNVPAYDSYLNTCFRGADGLCEAMKAFQTLVDRRCFPGTNFFHNDLEECMKSFDVRRGELLWESMVGRDVIRPDTEMYNSMISLFCSGHDYEKPKRLLDEMVYNGAFPNARTYNLLFQFMIKGRKLQEASVIFNEMVKNECIPCLSNCIAGIKIYLDGGPYMAIKVWKYMIENYDTELEETGNLLVLGLRDLNRLPEAIKYAEGMMERSMKLNSSTLSKLKQSLVRLGKEPIYNELIRKWKTCEINRCFECLVGHHESYQVVQWLGIWIIIDRCYRDGCL